MYRTIVQQLEDLGVFPIITIDDPQKSIPLGQALLEGGLRCAEFAFRTKAAADAMRVFAYRYPDMLLGAGTILTVEQAHFAISAGASFIVTPGFNPRVVDYCLEQGVTIFPGVCTPTEIEAALEKGLDVLKFFPAEAIGGLPYLQAICSPFQDIRFIPAGGITNQNLGSYLSFKNVLACGATWMVAPELIAAGEFEIIRHRVEATVKVVQTREETGVLK